jgi:ABC-type phosphate transport system substrate-binding protein
MLARVLVALLALFALATLDAKVRAAERPAFVVIVNPNAGTTSADRQFLEDAFLKKVTEWPGGADIHPCDLVPQSRVRRRFSEDVLQRSVEAVKAYWQQRIFSGSDVPPPEFGADQEVVAYVMRHDGGVGYVSADANLGGAKVLTVQY